MRFRELLRVTGLPIKLWPPSLFRARRSHTWPIGGDWVKKNDVRIGPPNEFPITGARP